VFKHLKDVSNLIQIKGDVRDYSLVKKALQGNESVIHLACISNDPSFEAHKKITENMRKTFAFQDEDTGHQGVGIDESLLSFPIDIEQLIGKWQSVDDIKSFKVFKSEGIIEEVYSGKIISTGTWEVIDRPELLYGNMVPAPFLKITINGEEYVYTSVFVKEPELSLTYLPRGSTLKYNRIVD